jgi:hypothetical protein
MLGCGLGCGGAASWTVALASYGGAGVGHGGCGGVVRSRKKNRWRRLYEGPQAQQIRKRKRVLKPREIH